MNAINYFQERGRTILGFQPSELHCMRMLAHFRNCFDRQDQGEIDLKDEKTKHCLEVFCNSVFRGSYYYMDLSNFEHLPQRVKDILRMYEERDELSHTEQEEIKYFLNKIGWTFQLDMDAQTVVRMQPMTMDEVAKFAKVETDREIEDEFKKAKAAPVPVLITDSWAIFATIDQQDKSMKLVELIVYNGKHSVKDMDVIKSSISEAITKKYCLWKHPLLGKHLPEIVE